MTDVRPAAETSRDLAALRRKLERWELLHLRQYIEELRTLLEQAERERDEALRQLSIADDCAERWRDDALRMIEQLDAQPGLTMSGHLVALPR